MVTPNHAASHLRLIRGSLIGASVLVAWDAAITGSLMMSVMVCPIWFFVSLVKAIIQRPGWRVGLSRVAVPVLTLAIVVGNAALQSKIATTNAERIIVACEQFRAATGQYPDQLDELVPKHLSSIPRAKYALMYGNFRYWNSEGKPRLMWTVVPPFNRNTYNFERRKWGSLD